MRDEGPTRRFPESFFARSGAELCILSPELSPKKNTNKSITLTATDVDGDALTYTIVIQPTKGTLIGTAPNITYKPNLNYIGDDNFTFKANDGQVDSNVATISITVKQ